LPLDLEFRSTLGVTTQANYNPHYQTGLVGGATADQSNSSASINEYNDTFGSGKTTLPIQQGLIKYIH
jgi:hypothetical protein